MNSTKSVESKWIKSENHVDCEEEFESEKVMTTINYSSQNFQCHIHFQFDDQKGFNHDRLLFIVSCSNIIKSTRRLKKLEEMNQFDESLSKRLIAIEIISVCKSE